MSKEILKLLGKNQVRAAFDNESINEEERTIDLVWTTGHKGLRKTSAGFQYYEQLDVSNEAIDQTRIVGGPLLAIHDLKNLDSVIGVIESVRVIPEERIGRGKVRFAKDEFSERVFQKVKDKILRNVSVGYDINDVKNISQKGDEIPTVLVKRWTPMEFSVVPIGFDPGANFRSQEQDYETEIEIEVKRLHETNTTAEVEKNMNEEEKKALEAKLKAEKDAGIKQGSEVEKQRQADIRFAVRSAKLDDKIAEDFITKDLQMDAVREQIILKLAEAEPKTVTNAVKVEVGTDERTKKREAAENALLHRVMPDSFQLSDAGREMRGMDMIRLATVLTNNSFGTDAEIATRAMSSSDLPLILANVAEKSVQKSYEIAPSTFEKWVNQRTLRNYKKANQVKAGDFPNLAERNEDGEFTEGYFSEGQEQVQLKKYGKILSMTEEMIVNDDLGVLAEFVTKAGGAAKRLESKLVYDRLQASTAMADTKALFHADHGNLGTSGAISETTMDELVQKLKNQKNLDNVDYLDLQARFLLCGLQNEVAARKFLATIIANQTSNVNPFAGSVELVVDPRITSKNWFLAADKSVIDSIVLYRLLGKEKPVVSTRNKWETGSFQIKVEHTAAAQAMEHRGIAKNPYT